jgi:hypothetical protein
VEIAGVTAGRTMDGLSLSRFLSGAATAWNTGRGPRHILVENDPLATRTLAFTSVRQEPYVYTTYKNGNVELYNLKTDSAEMTSRHADPALATVRQKLSAALTGLKTCVGPVKCW